MSQWMMLLTGFALNVFAGSTPLQTAAGGVRLTLSSQTIWQGEYGWCTFAAEIRQGRGAISNRCGGAGPFGTASPGPGGGNPRQRILTDSETTTLRRLYEDAALFDGGHIGADLSATDAPFQILMARATAGDHRAVVLVVTGNSTFSGGARRALVDWLVRERGALGR